MILKKAIGIVLLAAGNSRRYGEIKLLDEIEGKEMYLHIFDKIKHICCISEERNKGYFLPIQAAVTQYEEIARKSREYGFHTIRNPDPSKGISSSIKLGIEKVLRERADVEGILFSVCDQPHLTETTLIHMLESFAESEKGMAFASWGETAGNPSIFSKKYFKELLSLQGDTGGRLIAHQHPEDVLPVQVKNKKELMDIDTKSTGY